MRKVSDIALIGFASGVGGNVPGCKEGPDVLRRRGLVDQLRALGYQVKDCGNATQETAGRDPGPTFDKDEQLTNEPLLVYQACKDIYRKTARALADNQFPLVVGGDHSVSVGNVAALGDYYQDKGERIGLLWIDTHPDINTPLTSPSKNVFGMSVAILAGLVPGAFSSLQKHSPAVAFEHIAYVGLRDVDPGEREILADNNITAFTIQDIDIHGMANVMKRALETVTKGTAGFVTSFDLDVCDPAIVPGTGTPIRGGLNFREAHLALELVAQSEKLLGLELVELNPILDVQFKTADFAMALIESAMGKTIL